ncbi:thioredoxin fold domain-containing protein [Algoriphagus aestuariicola]|uniref:Thioredoxin fold domain-containing protein n=1 Tax=Algoriphagus aestuariicola TaxID=1852016 RepID=A0ABS3BND1_9BACT|nr:thioredoxin fold domain-containing protein [Algoriphagus aestuariicola]MBN7800792.1 thioredoxin fold domain-containing protein [Algoriphagus aestuariicola]
MKFKYLLSFCLLALVSFSLQAQEEITWMKFEEAIAANEQSPKMLIVDVYTDWCGWCKKMDKETFTDPKVIEHINKNFYAVKLNAEDTKRTFEFMGKKYNEAQMAAAMRVRSYPNFVVIEPKLQNIAQLPGYRTADQFLTGLDDLIDKAFKNKP